MELEISAQHIARGIRLNTYVRFPLHTMMVLISSLVNPSAARETDGHTNSESGTPRASGLRPVAPLLRQLHIKIDVYCVHQMQTRA